MKKEELLKFYSKYKLYIFPFIVSLSSLFLSLFAIYPQTVKLIENQQSADGIIRKSQFLESKVAALESFDEEDLSQKAGLVLASLPADKDFGNILDLLQRIVTESGFTVSSVSFGNSGGKSGNSEIYEVKLDVKGTKVTLSALLQNLENSPRLMKINSLDVLNQAAQSTDVALVIKVLYLQIPQNFGTADSPLPEMTEKDEEVLVRLAKESAPAPVLVDTPSFSRGKSNPFE